MERSWSRIGVCAVVLGFVLSLGAQVMAQADPFVGTWALNVEKSTFTGGGPGVRLRTLTITAKGDAFNHTQETYRQGQDAILRVVFDAKYDGTPAPVVGAAFNQVSFTRMGRTLTRKATDVGMEVETATYTLSADGKTLTIVTKGNNRGIEYGSTQVFQKQ